MITETQQSDNPLHLVKQTALMACSLNLAVFPPAETGEKRPDGEWKTYQTQRPDKTTVAHWYKRARTGVGLVTGAVSGNLELLEFDASGAAYEELKALAVDAGLGDVVDHLEQGYLEQSPSGGWHWLYRCSEIDGNQKLATGANGQTLIETRGEGGYVVIAPSFGRVHPSGKPYRLLSGGLDTIPTITPAERQELFNLARTLDQRKPTPTPAPAPAPARTGGLSPIDDFNNRESWENLLPSLGWVKVCVRGDTTHWRRPGKEKGVSASTQGEVFYCFTTSTCLAANKGYTKFQVLTHWNYGGDVNAAVKAIAGMGFGERPASTAKAGKPGVKAGKPGAKAGKPGAKAGKPEPAANDPAPASASEPEPELAEAINQAAALGWRGQRRGPDPAEPAEPAGAEHGATADNAALAGLDPYRGTDDANADLLLKRHGDDIRYCPPWDKWLIWTGSHWRIDDALEVEKLAADAPRDIYRAAADSADSNRRTHLGKLARALERVSTRRAMLTAARHKIVVHHSDLDRGTFLLNVANGTLDLAIGALRPHSRRDLLTHDTGIEYRPDAEAPTWRSYLKAVFAEDVDLIRFVQKAVGYSLTGDIREQVLLICHGSGSNGKSVFLNILRALVGRLAFQAAPDLLLADKNRRHPTEQADLYGRRLVICQETAKGRRFNEVLVKQLTGGDAITARRMHEDFWSFEPTHKLWLSTNHKPEILGTDHAIWRRIRLIPFAVKFHDPGDGEPVKDTGMQGKLLAELPGILTWAMQGCLAWQREGLNAPAAVTQATARYREEMDVLAAWIADCCVVARNAEAPAKQLYHSYVEWCDQQNETPEKQRRFGMQLTERGFVRFRNNDHWWKGIGLKAERHEFTDPTDPTDPEKAIFQPIGGCISKTAKQGSVGSVGSVNEASVDPLPPADAVLSQQPPPMDAIDRALINAASAQPRRPQDLAAIAGYPKLADLDQRVMRLLKAGLLGRLNGGLVAGGRP